MLSKSPGFTLAAVLSLAIGIGANTALFTLINTVMWKRLPVSDPEHLLTIGQQSQAGTSHGFTYQQYELFRDHGQALDLAAYSLSRLDASIDGHAEPTLDAQLVTGEYFPILGLRPALGRLLDERRRPRPDGTSGRRAQPHLLAAPLCRRCRRDRPRDHARRPPVHVVGVTPAEFFGAEVGMSPSLYLPVMMQPALLPVHGSLLDRPNVFAAWLRLLGRLKPGVPLEQAGAPAQRAWPGRRRPSGGPGTSSRDSSRTHASW